MTAHRSLDVRVMPGLEGRTAGQMPRLALTGEGQIVDRRPKRKGIWCCTGSRSLLRAGLLQEGREQ